MKLKVINKQNVSDALQTPRQRFVRLDGLTNFAGTADIDSG